MDIEKRIEQLKKEISNIRREFAVLSEISDAVYISLWDEIESLDAALEERTRYN